MAKKRRVGRPRKAAGDKRSEKVEVALTSAEKAEIERQAGDTPLGKFIRELALKRS